MVNSDKVEQLVEAALIGMEQVPDCDGAELTSAGFTLAARLIKVALLLDPMCSSMLREGCEQLLLRCADPTQRN